MGRPTGRHPPNHHGGAATQTRTPFQTLCRDLNTLIRLYHHQESLEAELLPKAFRQKVTELGNFLKPAKPSQDLSEDLSYLASEWGSRTRDRLLAHYQEEAASTLRAISTSPVPTNNWDTATEVALNWAKARMRKKLSQATRTRFLAKVASLKDRQRAPPQATRGTPSNSPDERGTTTVPAPNLQTAPPTGARPGTQAKPQRHKVNSRERRRSTPRASTHKATPPRVNRKGTPDQGTPRDVARTRVARSLFLDTSPETETSSPTEALTTQEPPKPQPQVPPPTEADTPPQASPPPTASAPPTPKVVHTSPRDSTTPQVKKSVPSTVAHATPEGPETQTVSTAKPQLLPPAEVNTPPREASIPSTETTRTHHPTGASSPQGNSPGDTNQTMASPRYLPPHRRKRDTGPPHSPLDNPKAPPPPPPAVPSPARTRSGTSYQKQTTLPSPGKQFPAQVSYHRENSQYGKMTNWKIRSQTDSQTLVLGTSNLNRITHKPRKDMEIHSYAGARFDHMENMLAKMPVDQNPRRVVIALGINDSTTDRPLPEVKNHIRNTARLAKLRFPLSQIYMAEVNHSNTLQGKALHRTQEINGTIRSLQDMQGVKTLPKLPPWGVVIEPRDRSKIHWTPTTANNILAHWNRNLN